ncbi:MAG: hypothetical protein Q7R66_08140 [Undibacterium sp.]|uniref:hypothetical protein n=1 Tax=Undibacterium sp. TaxID=1914977 RepID=UPI00271949D1|nr:hypothetical protein [Undibacterium sp.]MDO8652142.1 hypothetical protein [Undibacterium sp.]
MRVSSRSGLQAAWAMRAGRAAMMKFPATDVIWRGRGFFDIRQHRIIPISKCHHRQQMINRLGDELALLWPASIRVARRDMPWRPAKRDAEVCGYVAL